MGQPVVEGCWLFWSKYSANAAVGASLKPLSESTIMKFLSGDEQLDIFRPLVLHLLQLPAGFKGKEEILEA